MNSFIRHGQPEPPQPEINDSEPTSLSRLASSGSLQGRPQPKCSHPNCKDGGSPPFYTFYEKDNGGWRTGRSVVICHTCYYNGARPKFRGDMVVPPIETPVVESNIAESVEVQKLQQEDTRQLVLQQKTTQSSYSGQQMKTIIEYPAPASEEIVSGHDEKMNVTLLTHDINGLSTYSNESDVMKRNTHEEKHENEHSTLPGKKPAPRRHKKE